MYSTDVQKQRRFCISTLNMIFQIKIMFVSGIFNTFLQQSYIILMMYDMYKEN